MTGNRRLIDANDLLKAGSGLALVKDVRRFVRRYVVMTNEQLLVTTLWVLHTHCIQAFEQTPYLAVTSPEKQCGKSRLLETLDLLVARPWQTVLPSEAVVYRRVHQEVPTLLLDEIDTVFNPKSADRYEGLRAILNAGHRKGAKVPRCVGPKHEVVEFDVYCAKVLAGIGSLPDTVADRSIPIRLERKKRDEKVSRFLRREVKPNADALREEIEQWADVREDELAAARPVMPDELSDRMQEGCEPLLAIADACGCGEKSRVALVELLTGERLDDQETLRLRLLRDLRTAWEAREKKRGRRVRAIRTTALLADLCAMDEAPWASYYGHGMEARDLASLLKPYGIHSQAVRNDGKVVKGYKRDDLYDAWQRYLS